MPYRNTNLQYFSSFSISKEKQRNNGKNGVIIDFTVIVPQIHGKQYRRIIYAEITKSLNIRLYIF